MSLIVDTPKSPVHSFLVVKGNNIKLTQASSRLHHAAEFSKVILSEKCSDNTAMKSVLLVISDNGPDHRLCMVHQTCPYQSWTNPAERVMSILSLALQNVSLERKAMDEESREVAE